jgi:hypothetical protein
MAENSPTVKWIPVDFMDEGGPSPRDDKEDWLARLDDGAPCLRCMDAWAGDEPLTHPLKDGETVEFSKFTDFGSARLDLNADGSFTVDRDMPAGAEQCCIMLGWQSETLSESVGETVKMLIEAGGEPDDYMIAYYTYSEGIPFVFRAAASTFEGPAEGEADPAAVAASLTDPQRAVVRAGAGDDVEAGIGTWMLLKRARVVDAEFKLTPLGEQVRDILIREVANG